MTLIELNNLSKEDLVLEFQKCCTSKNWIEKMVNLAPFTNEDTLIEKAETTWNLCNENDWLEAFKGHPKIGDINSLKEKYNNTKAWAGNEQSGVNIAPEEILIGLAEGNKDYEDKFGFIFIVFATGKSAGEMLNLLKERLPNSYENEIKIAAGEQNKITKLRLRKLLGN